MDREQIKNTAFQPDEELFNKKIEAVPRPEKEIGIDLTDSILMNIISSNDGISSQFDASSLQNLTSISRNRNQLYETLDYMATDSAISAILETYAEDATETNDNGDIVWVESSNPNAAAFISYLLDALCINKNIYDWTHSLCKYGDLYVRLYRESEYDNFLFGDAKENQDKEDDSDKNPNRLNEDVKIKAYTSNDHYVHYVEKVDNPAQMFELTKFGKTAAYVQTDVQATSSNNADDVTTLSSFINTYRFNKNDVTLYQPTEFVHACLQDNTTRYTEELQLFITNADNTETDMTYKVKRGQALLYNSYKIWRQLQLLETSVLLNRITQSSIVRTIGVEVVDMSKESVGPHLQGIKNLIEQKTAFDVGNSMNEYTNPGPMINNIYIPTRNGQGAITASQIGGDVDVKSLADLEYYRDKFYGTSRIPKAYFGITDDGAGFNGGTSLSIISSRYAKMIKRIQNIMCQLVTDIINLILLDTGNQQYINDFTIRMMAPTTQEEIDRRENVVAKIGLVSDVMNNLGDISNNETKLKILKSLLSNAVTDPEVIQLIQEEIDSLEAERINQENESSEENIDAIDTSAESDDLSSLFSDTGTSSTAGGDDFEDLFSTSESDTETSSDSLPSPADLNIGDVSDSTNPELA